MLEVKQVLATTRLLTLAGTGGSGKTRLALDVARGLLETYPDGVWLVELAPLSEEELVPKVVAGALGVPERPGEPLAETLIEVLGDRQLLLILDNCEHLVEAAARLVALLLDSCPQLRVLATSREALGVEGEFRWAVPPLAVPQSMPLSAEELENYESVQLFIERAKSHDRAFSLSPQNTFAVADICRRLEGIPLAIELAAARVEVLSVHQVAEKLIGSLELLSGGARTAASRQRTLKSTLDWSYDLLSQSEMVLFRRFSVFTGGWTLDAAEAVGSGDGVEEGELLDLLSELVKKSLVVAEPAAEGKVRYRLLEPIRQYALEKLEESGEAENIKRSHSTYFLALAEEAEPELIGLREVEWWDRLENELDNIRAALSWASERGETEFGLRLAGALRLFWLARRHTGEGRRWLEEALAGEGEASTMVRVKALQAAAHLAVWQNDIDRVKAASEEGLRLGAEVGVKGGHDVALFLAWLSQILLFRGDPEQATKQAEESLRLSRQVNDVEGIVDSLLSLGWASGDRGDYEQAEKVFDEALALSRETGSTILPSLSLGGLGWTSLYQGDLERATAYFEEVAALMQELGDTVGLEGSLSNLGWLALLRGDLERAKSLHKESLTLSREVGSKAGAADSLEGLACAAGANGDALRATRLFGAAGALHEAMDIPLAPDERKLQEPYMARVRIQLDEGSWTKAWEEGRAMSLEEAIGHALSEEEPSTTPTTSQQPPVSAPEYPAGLTAREAEVLKLVASGMTSAQVAKELFLSPRTVHTHLTSVYRKLGVSSRAAAIRFALEHGLT